MARTKKARRIQMLVLGCALLAGSATLFGMLAQDAIAFFKSPTELVEQGYGPDQLLRVGGLVVEGTRATEGPTHLFEVTDGNGTVPVAFTGVLPDLFREGQGIVAEGYWREGRFEATEVLAKHDENYMPKEVADALRKQGHWEGDTLAEEPSGGSSRRAAPARISTAPTTGKAPMSYPFDWVDAFTDKAFGGNACVVVHDAAALEVADRLALVRETSLSECAFVVPSDAADFGARYYLTEREILMAGHPTIATVTSLIHRGLVDLSGGRATFTLEVGAGILPIEVAVRDGGPPLVTMTQRAPAFGAVQDAGEIAAIVGLDAGDIAHPPQIVSTGTPFCVTVLRDEGAMRRAVLDVQALERWRASSGEAGAALMEPFLVLLGGATPEGDTFARLLLAPPMPAEDPFTGSATGCMAAYLWHHGLIEQRFAAEQGHWMGRPGRAEVEVLGPPDAIEGVRVGGSGVVLMQGELLL